MIKFGLNDQVELDFKQKILSPSDFGLHNSIYNKNNQHIFIDFEYFGWDDPVKLVADFLHHAGQDLDQDARFEIMSKFVRQVNMDQTFFNRLSVVLDLVGLELILIILNIANPEVLKRRLYANPQLNVTELVAQRLTKAKERSDLFHTNIKSNNVFLSLKSIHLKIREIPTWHQLIT
jgi:hypothetical protein